MKVSIKFRDEQKPVIRAKVPLTILGCPFQSGIVAGESKELSLNLGTFFDSGPAFRFCYRPNDSFNPFSLVFKSGIGHFGSPISSSITMTAQFNLVGSQNPSFFVHFKPQLGDFTLKKSHSSLFPKSLISNSDSKVSEAEKKDDFVELPPVTKNGYFLDSGLFSGKKFAVLPPEVDVAGVTKDFLSGMEVNARTAVPLKGYAMMNFQWGMRLPVEKEGSFTTTKNHQISLKKFPMLVMNKIGIEHVVQDEKNKKGCNEVAELSSKVALGKGDVGGSYFDVKRELEMIQYENGKLRKAMDDLRSEIIGKKTSEFNAAFTNKKRSEGNVNEDIEKKSS